MKPLKLSGKMLTISTKEPVKIPFDELQAALKEAETGTSNPGFCLACGEQQEGCEPDARQYECESCGCHQVYGAAEILMIGAHT